MITKAKGFSILNHMVKLFPIFLFILFLPGVTVLRAEQSSKVLFISLPAATKDLDPTDLIKAWASNKDVNPFYHEMHIFNATSSQSDLLDSNLNLYGGLINIFRVQLHYPEELNSLTPVSEIAQNYYPESALKLINSAVIEILNIINDFKKKNLTGIVYITSSGMSGEIIIELIKEYSLKIDKVVFYYPTMAMVSEAKLVNALRSAGYTENNATVILYDGDPTIPQLEKQKTMNKEVFEMFVVETIQ